MGFFTYIKRGIKYVLKEHKETIVKADIYQKTPNDDLKEKIVVITGGGSGLGYYIAKKMVAEVAKVIITGRNEEKLKKAVNEFKNNAEYYVYDIQDIKKGEAIMEEIYQK